MCNSNIGMSKELENNELIYYNLLQVLVLLPVLVSSGKGRHGEFRAPIKYYIHFFTFYSIYSHIWIFSWV